MGVKSVRRALLRSAPSLVAIGSAVVAVGCSAFAISSFAVSGPRALICLRLGLIAICSSCLASSCCVVADGSRSIAFGRSLLDRPLGPVAIRHVDLRSSASACRRMCDGDEALADDGLQRATHRERRPSCPHSRSRGQMTFGAASNRRAGNRPGKLAAHAAPQASARSARSPLKQATPAGAGRGRCVGSRRRAVGAVAWPRPSHAPPPEPSGGHDAYDIDLGEGDIHLRRRLPFTARSSLRRVLSSGDRGTALRCRTARDCAIALTTCSRSTSEVASSRRKACAAASKLASQRAARRRSSASRSRSIWAGVMLARAGPRHVPREGGAPSAPARGPSSRS